ncbi:glycosyltransferase family 2 protein [Sulfitobacter guttiformis]|uniref:Glycosyl transferase family 2 n=1 Tax=Sulfitobacter guttiformis TaxID=74349 RepID=A0A420DN05_9RHOB|nr:glycosyltransferase family 2 protein [Sulfitobacter guttiformis]KIN72976.1 Glycosyl transferase, family 2 [Sulfitobacter guttiformis KCTC 32187]RKE95664.1 glycosyl transferase family 2 [Sulfitobacter guttiformis]
MQTWGIVATVKADAPTILRFVAYHLELGAHRIFIYLDAPCPEAQEALRAHPRCRAVLCDEGYWNRHNNGTRPAMHQPRQTINATRAYNRADGEVDWLMHMDVDEFLVAEGNVASCLSALPSNIKCARARPMELLAGGDPQTGAAFKTFIPAGKEREQIVSVLYPTFGQHLKGGFLSHIAGKIFVRTGVKGLKFRIHNAFLAGETNPDHFEMSNIRLAHFHATNWETWLAHFNYRLAQGSYRADLGPARSRERGGITTHELFTAIRDEEGEAGLAAFFDEVCADTPALRGRLKAVGHLHCASFPFDTSLTKHFPDFAII